jgi:cytochrome c
MTISVQLHCHSFHVNAILAVRCTGDAKNKVQQRSITEKYAAFRGLDNNVRGLGKE